MNIDKVRYSDYIYSEPKMQSEDAKNQYHICEIECADNENIFRTPPLASRGKLQKVDNRYFLELELSPYQRKFYTFLSNLDDHHVEQVFKNVKRWFKKQIPYDILEDYSKPTLKLGKNGKPIWKIRLTNEFYQANREILEKINKEYVAIYTIRIRGIKFLKQQFSTEFECVSIMSYHTADLQEDYLYSLFDETDNTNENVITDSLLEEYLNNHDNPDNLNNHSNNQIEHGGSKIVTNNEEDQSYAINQYQEEVHEELQEQTTKIEKNKENVSLEITESCETIHPNIKVVETILPIIEETSSIQMNIVEKKVKKKNDRVTINQAQGEGTRRKTQTQTQRIDINEKIVDLLEEMTKPKEREYIIHNVDNDNDNDSDKDHEMLDNSEEESVIEKKSKKRNKLVIKIIKEDKRGRPISKNKKANKGGNNEEKVKEKHRERSESRTRSRSRSRSRSQSRSRAQSNNVSKSKKRIK